MNYLFTSESVSEGHPDKVADQISDSILDEFLRQDPESKVAVETFCTAGLVIVGGEVRSENAYVDIQKTVRNTISRIGYTKAEYGFDASSCGVISTIHEQSADINRGVVRSCEDEQGAGDQGMMFGYACKDTPEYMPLALYLSHNLLKILAEIRHKGSERMFYLRPDAKAQFTIEYSSETHKPLRVHTIVLSTQHDEFDSDDAMHARIEKDVREVVLPALISGLPENLQALFDEQFILHEPHRKIRDRRPSRRHRTYRPQNYSGLLRRTRSPWRWSFSGKDPARWTAALRMPPMDCQKPCGRRIADECLVQLAYAIGIAEPVSIFVNSYGTAHIGDNARADALIASKLRQLFDLRPAAIIRRFCLKNPIYSPTAAYGHFGRAPYIKDGIQFFGWEKLDAVPILKEAFGG